PVTIPLSRSCELFGKNPAGDPFSWQPAALGRWTMRSLKPVMLAALLGTVAALAVTGQKAEPAGKKYALLVGVTKYKHNSLPDLAYPERDVEELGKVLAGFDKVVLLTSGRGEKDDAARPTAANFRK